MIATDLMARGVDFVGINSVLNFDFPDSAITYIHRVGRTGRAGHSGAGLMFSRFVPCVRFAPLLCMLQ